MFTSDFRNLSLEDKTLIFKSWLPGVPDISKTGMSPHVMQKLTDAMWECSAPLGSYVLNRVVEWVDGKTPFTGNDVFEISWSKAEAAVSAVFSKKGKSKPAPRHCTIHRLDDGATWRLTWSVNEYRDVPKVVLSRIGPAGDMIDIVSGEITTGAPDSGNRNGFSNCPAPVKGTIEADIDFGGFEALCEFSKAIRGSIPDELLKVQAKDAVTFAHERRLESLQPILDVDGGLPGRLSLARHELIVQWVNEAAGTWMRPRYSELISGLRERGAVWGKGILKYNDSDYYCGLVDFSDGSIGLFSDNIAACADEHAYVARLDMDGDTVKSVGVHVFDKDDRDYRMKIDAIGQGVARPAYVYDYEEEIATCPGGREGWIAMTMFLWQSMVDSTYALKDGKLDEDSWYWRPRLAGLAS